jgi:hypothetical protein
LTLNVSRAIGKSYGIFDLPIAQETFKVIKREVRNAV